MKQRQYMFSSRWNQGYTDLVILQAILKYVLNNQAACLAQSNFVPHTAQGLVDELHDLGRSLTPPQFEQFLPNVAGISMNDRLGDTTKEFVDHDSLVVLRNRIECLLDDVAAKWIHREVERVSTDGFSNLDDLLRGAMLEAPLDKKVAKAIDHEWISLGNNGLNDVEFLLWCSHLELLLEEYRCLLVIVADNLVNNILPVAVDAAVKETAVVQGLSGRQIGLPLGSYGLNDLKSVFSFYYR